MSNIFDEIETEREHLPEFKTLTDSVIGKYPLNMYQKIALLLFFIGAALGFIIGNLQPSCVEFNQLTATCLRSEFNLSITLIIWGISFLITLFIYMFGHLIVVLQSIDQKLGN